MVEYNGATTRDYSLDRMPQTLPALQKAIIRVDQTAGRAMYIWDSLNAREQIIYGDTGWRDISASLVIGTGTAFIRRVGGVVEIVLAVAFPTSTPNGTLFLAIPSGFISTQYKTYASTRPSTGPTITGVNARVVSGSIYLGTAANWDNAWGNLEISLSYTVVTAWPTALPGTASGAIPNL